MSKFHINKNGVPAPCKAKEGNCPLGGAESHFDNAEQAQKFANEKFAKEHGVVKGLEEVHKVKLEEPIKMSGSYDHVADESIQKIADLLADEDKEYEDTIEQEFEVQDFDVEEIEQDVYSGSSFNSSFGNHLPDYETGYMYRVSNAQVEIRTKYSYKEQGSDELKYGEHTMMVNVEVENEGEFENESDAEDDIYEKFDELKLD